MTGPAGPERASPAPAELRVAVIGRGRLGGFAAALLDATPGFRCAGSYASGDDWRSAVAAGDVDVALEATVAGRGEEHGLALLERGVRPVVGTSGVGPEGAARLDARARELGLGGLVVPNFSLGALLLARAVEAVAAHLPDAEIVELHHAGKRDAPSATARELARAVERARRAAPDAPAGDVPIHSVRLPGLHAHHEVLLGGQGESLTLRHDVHGPEAFGPGLLRALRHAATARGVAYGLEPALDAP